MTASCQAPLTWAQLTDYWAGDLPAAEQDALDEHLMGCAACSVVSARAAALTETLRGMIPPVISVQLAGALRRRGLTVLENAMQPGERREVVFPAEVDVLLHRLTGMPLADAARVRFTLSAESTGQLLADIDGVPFDPATGSVLVACQKHYAGFPHDTVAELRVRSHSGDEAAYRFTILHQFP